MKSEICYSPRDVSGDGNCMYRAISLSLFGDQSHHVQLRLLTALEMLENSKYYNSQHPKFADLINDVRVVTPPYTDNYVRQLGCYSDLINLFALSAVLSAPIRSGPYRREPRTMCTF